MSREQIISGIIVSIIAALGGWLAARAAANATVKNVSTSSRVEMEKEAYERARKLDTDTIARQDEELEELRTNQRAINEDVKLVNRENERLHRENIHILDDNARLREELRQFRLRFTKYERGLPKEIPSEVIRERETDVHPIIYDADTNPMMREVDFNDDG